MSRVYVVLLNWNNWADTLECLESLALLDFPDFRIIICDNGSSDDSLERVRAWADGTLDVIPEGLSWRPRFAPVDKPLPYVEYDRNAAEIGGEKTDTVRLVLIRNEENLGFAGGNNVGLRFALAREDADFVWVLNNDTVVDGRSLQAMVARMEASPEAGICGSSILSYRSPKRIDALGGAYYCRWLGLAWHLGRFRRFSRFTNTETVEKRMDYVVGSSMLVSRRFLKEIGLLEESYFLYFEELDWALRSKGKFRLVYAPDSIVYHKVGGTIGTSSHPARKSLLSDFYTLRNRIKFTCRHYPHALPTIYLGLLIAVLVRLVFGEWRRALMVWRLLVDPRRSFEQCITLS